MPSVVLIPIYRYNRLLFRSHGDPPLPQDYDSTADDADTGTDTEYAPMTSRSEKEIIEHSPPSGWCSWYVYYTVYF